MAAGAAAAAEVVCDILSYCSFHPPNSPQKLTFHMSLDKLKLPTTAQHAERH